MRKYGWVTALCTALLAHTGLASEVKLGDKGWEINSSDSGKVVIGYPKIGTSGKLIGPGDATVHGKAAVMSYDNGAQLRIEEQAEGVYRCHFQSLPDSVQSFRMESKLPISFAGKASWRINNQEQPFPVEYGGKPALFQGDAKRLSITGSNGDGFAVIMDYGFMKLQDNRQWKNNSFLWFTASAMPRSRAGEAYRTVRIANTPDGMPAAAAPKPASKAADVPASTKLAFAFGEKKSEKKLFINAGVAGNFETSLPWFADVKGGQPTDAQLSADGRTLSFKYPVGGSGKITLNDTESVTVSFADLPEQAGKVRMKTTIPGLFKSGGKYAIGGAGPNEFPQDKPEKPFLFQGHTTEAFSLLHSNGAGFAISGFGPGTFQQLQDNREWNNGTFTWWFSLPLPAGNPTPGFTLKLASPVGGSVAIKPQLDRFGQVIAKDFPEKITSEEQLQADVAADRAYYASLQPPALDRFGGLPGSGEKYGLKKTGFFHVEKIGNTQVLVDPDGNLFFQLGICVLGTPGDDYTLVKGREGIYEWLPARKDPTFRTAWRPKSDGIFSFYLANRIRKYGEPFERAAFYAETIERVRKWGFNSAGAWSETPPEVGELIRQRTFPYTPFLPSLGKASQVMYRVWDAFDENIEQIMDAAFSQLAEQADDPQVIGYFLVNEPRIQNLPRIVPGLKASESPSKARLVRMLQEKYGTIVAYNEAWGAKAARFDDLKETPLVVSTRQAGADMAEFYAAFLDRRYSLVHKYLRKYDPHHLLIGDRWMVDTANSEVLMRTAGKYYDIISVNYYTGGVDKDFLKRLHDWSGGRPLLLSEFYYSSGDQGLQVGGRGMTTQTERGLAYRNYVEQAASTGFVVGIQWFSHLDQSATGRYFQGFNGEGAANGLVNVADRPYKAFLAEVMKTNYSIYPVLMREKAPFVFDDPRFTPRAGGRKGVGVSRMTKPVVLDGGSEDWPTVPGTRVDANGLIWGKNADNLEGTFRLGWDDTNLYLFAEVVDPTPMQNGLSNAKVWASDCIELFVGSENLDEGGLLQFGDRQVMLRGAKAGGELAAALIANAPRKYEAQVTVVPGLDGKSYAMEAAIPFEALGFMPKPGREILFDLCINDGTGGARRAIAWNGTARKERGAWGKARFMK